MTSDPRGSETSAPRFPVVLPVGSTGTKIRSIHRASIIEVRLIERCMQGSCDCRCGRRRSEPSLTTTLARTSLTTQLRSPVICCLRVGDGVLTTLELGWYQHTMPATYKLHEEAQRRSPSFGASACLRPEYRFGPRDACRRITVPSWVRTVEIERRSCRRQLMTPTEVSLSVCTFAFPPREVHASMEE